MSHVYNDIWHMKTFRRRFNIIGKDRLPLSCPDVPGLSVQKCLRDLKAGADGKLIGRYQFRIQFILHTAHMQG